MDKRKTAVVLIAAFVIMPLISYVCYKKIFAVSYIQALTENGFLYLSAYAGIIAINYMIFLTLKYKEIQNKTKLLKIRFIISFILLLFMMYLSIPAYLTALSSKTKNKAVEELAVKLSVFPCQKSAVNSHINQNLMDIYISE
ncbi:MAG: hypothetical protein LUH05_10165 [Candidatus Gastranaerophilales bacterium]|nr:hypothetical protein [Candidatus Gastranaerophilales bacterium]